MPQRHLPQKNKIAGGPSSYFGDKTVAANVALEDRCYTTYSGSHIRNPNDTTSARQGRDLLPTRQTNSNPKTGSFMVPPYFFDPEENLTATRTYVENEDVLPLTQFSISSPSVFAFTVPVDWPGTDDGGVVLNMGGTTGALVVIASDGRIGAASRYSGGSSPYNYVLSNLSAVGPGDRVVVQFRAGSEGRIRLWVEGLEVTHSTLYENTHTQWTGGNLGSYLEQDAEIGQRATRTPFPDSGGWETMPQNRVQDGTWGSLTLYANQTV